MVFVRFLVISIAMVLGCYTNVPASPIESSWFIDMNKYMRSAHASLDCQVCHKDINKDGKTHPGQFDSNLLKSNIKASFDYKQCKTCHKTAYKDYMKGAHAKAFIKAKAKNKRAPTCGDCHSSHYVKAYRSRYEIGKEEIEVCGKCHPAQKDSYMEDFHGKTAVGIGNSKAAYCTDCHGAHESLSLKDSSIALKACKRCHLKAEDRFSEFVIHVVKDKTITKDNDLLTRIKTIKAISLISLIFVVMVLGFFYGHSILLILRKIHEKLRKNNG